MDLAPTKTMFQKFWWMYQDSAPSSEKLNKLMFFQSKSRSVAISKKCALKCVYTMKSQHKEILLSAVEAFTHFMLRFFIITAKKSGIHTEIKDLNTIPYYEQ